LPNVCDQGGPGRSEKKEEKAKNAEESKIIWTFGIGFTAVDRGEKRGSFTRGGAKVGGSQSAISAKVARRNI